ncbi:hypothetical protein CLOBOL_05685 [Enterocloster bolteae ATCC BAA-613]|uniref:Uncharacterized protein n=1 Tax=Enterocloster bolteae (strain ATCC BAA-613 / DSM 15670 / CCUG 46953 / JCM 12243 / WAL 16351) TaxID=411902 RepID=A8S0I5_ENTBW|nr:hypothetical protein CLOBOL_05685 [Enterocloster bolteae ATCC BAA-613]
MPIPDAGMIKAGLFFRDVVFSSTLPSLLSYRGNTGQGRTRDLVKKSLEQKPDRQ